MIERLEDRRLLAARQVWTPSADAPSFDLDRREPAAYASFALDEAKLHPVLESAPWEFALGPKEPAGLRPEKLRGELILPTPDGGSEAFKLVEISIMDEALAAALPDVATYRGVSADGASTVRLTTTPRGLHASVQSSAGHFIVDPIEGDPKGLYMSYFQSDLGFAPDDFFDFDHDHDHGDHADGSADDHDDDDVLPPGAPPATQTTGPDLRTYRLAVAATAEFTARHGQTVASAQAKIVEAINDANALYEREMAIRFTLVDNSSIVYLNAMTDPYTNTDRTAMLNENQANLDNVIGNSNYDIGHVFATSGGGRASVGVVGVTGRKARGVSANNLNFSTLTVSHEIGHQFSSRHTWNGALGSCTASQWNADFSMEPGSGSTIMSYGGFCGADNVVTTRDEYFHSVSYDAIVSHATSRAPGVGSITATGNTAPVVDAGPDYTIPAETPFELSPPEAIDNEGDVITYNWEQRDLGTGRKALDAADDGLGPLFRSYPKNADRTRSFPRLENLLENTLPLGEQLPSTNRELNLRLNANDGRGGTSSDSMVITVIATGAPFAVTSPNTAVTWPALSQQTVTWDVAATNTGAINAGTVDILLSTDGGYEFDLVLAEGVANDGSEQIVLPPTTTENARIKVKPVGNIFFDVSNSDFTISAPVLTDDFGDAPAPYPVLIADDGPRHSSGGPVLGATVDLEIDGQPSPFANGDGADEDGLSIVEPFVAGQTSNVSVSTTTGGELDMFIDFDGNGVFGNASEEIIRTTLPIGRTLIPIAVPVDAVSETFVRLRLSSAGGLGPTGPATGGEVEDHRIVVFAEPPGIDYGDAEAYATRFADDGARHVLSGTLRLGERLDAEADAIVDTAATGDGRDDDGVIFRQLLRPGATVKVDVFSGGVGVLDFFFDFDQDGTFGNNSDEVFSQPVVAGWQEVSFEVPSSALAGVTVARFRLSSAGGLSSTGLAYGGEVEDYQVVIAEARGEVLLADFDDASVPQLPAGWSSTQLGNAWGTQSSNSDTPPNSVFVPNIDAVSDVHLDSPPFVVEVPDTVVRFRNWYATEANYDGGVLEISINGAEPVDILTAGAVFESGGYNGTIDTDFGNPLKGREAWSGSSNGYIDSEVRLPNSLLGSTISLRWRFGTDQSVVATGWRIDTVSYDGAPFLLDYGDAPDPNYPTLTANDGAGHVVGDVFLGATVDAEIDGQPNTASDGDDVAGTADEDGVSFPAGLYVGTNHVDVTSSTAAILNLWIDADANGNWSDAVDHVIKDQVVSSGASSIAFELPAGMPLGASFARVRLSHQAGLAPDGVAGDGEVEDYRIQFASLPSVSVEDVQLNGEAEERSQLRSVVVKFNGRAAATKDAFEVRNRLDGSLVPLTVSLTENDAKTIATITFDAGANVVTRASGNSLIDGNYQLNVLSAQVDNLAADYQFGTTAADKFFRHYGDSDGDRDVDGQDYGRFGLSFLKQSDDPGFDSSLDADGDGDVDGQDYGNFGTRFLTTMPFS